MSFDASANSLEEKYSTSRSILRNLTPMISPPKRGRPSDIASEIMVLPEGMNYSANLTPYMIEPFNLTTSRRHSSVIFVSPARTGKSVTLIDGKQAHIISSDPCDNLTIFPTEAMARRYARLRFDKLVKNSPELAQYLTKEHNKDNVLNKEFTHGMSSWFGSPTPTNLAGSDYKICMWSDADRGEDENSDGDIFTQLSKRTQTFGSAGMTIVESSPSRDVLDPNFRAKTPHEAPPVSGILGLYNEGDRRMFYWECPHCKENGKPTLIHLKAQFELFCLPDIGSLVEEISESSPKHVAEKYAKIYCPHCGGQLDERNKAKYNKTGKWIQEVQRLDHDKTGKWDFTIADDNAMGTFWLSGIAAKYQSWSSILTKYFKALMFYEDTGDESKLKAVFNVDMGMPYIPKSISTSITAEEIESMSVDIGKQLVPEWGRYLLASIDVQAHMFVVQVEAWGEHNTRAIIDRFNITLSNRFVGDEPQGIEPATYAEDWDRITELVIMKRYELENDTKNRTMGIHLTVCDSGGTYSSTKDSTVTELAYLYWKKMSELGFKDKFELLKGTRPTQSSNAPALRRSVLTKQSSAARKTKLVGQVAIWLINTTLIKDTSVGLLKKKTGNGRIFFPDWLGSWFYKELTAEVRTDKGWENVRGRRNEAFDLLVYCKCANLILMDRYFSGKINWQAPPAWADVWDKNSNVLDQFKSEDYEDSTPRTSRPVRGSFKQQGFR